MSINITTSQDGITVKFDGPLNFSINEAFETTIEQPKKLAPKPKRVTFDLARVNQIDSVGLGLLYIAHEDFSDLRVPFTLAEPSEPVKRLLELTESEKTFDIRR